MTKFELKLLLPHGSTIINSSNLFVFKMSYFKYNGTYKKTKKCFITFKLCRSIETLEVWLTSSIERGSLERTLSQMAWRTCIFMLVVVVLTRDPQIYVDGKNSCGEVVEEKL